MLHPYTAEIPAQDLTVDTPIALNGGGPAEPGYAITRFARVTSVTPDGDRIAVTASNSHDTHIVHPDAVFVVAVRNPHCAGGMFCRCPHSSPCSVRRSAHDVTNCQDIADGCAECEALTCRDCGELKSDDPSTMVGDDLCGTCRDKADNKE